MDDRQPADGVGIWGLLLVGAVVVVAVIFLLTLSPSSAPKADRVALSNLAAEARAGQVERLTMRGESVVASLRDGREIAATRERNVSVYQTLRSAGVGDQQLAQIAVEAEDAGDAGWLSLALWLVPLALVIGFLFILARRPGSSPMDQASVMGRSRARRITADRPLIRFSDVAGIDEAKQELQEVVEFLSNPRRFIALGAHVPRGVLLAGPPGTGKTLLSRAVAGEAGVPFFSISGSEFVEMFVGVGAARVRDLFDEAKRCAPCLVFIDEIDAVGRRRQAGGTSGHDEWAQTLNQILVEMDGFDTHTNVIVIGATNRPDVLDPALLRPGRFDRRVVIDNPDLHGRHAILTVHARGKPLAAGVDLLNIARETAGLSGADLENLLNEAAILAGRRESWQIEAADVEEAVDRVITGPERRSRLMSEREKLITAFHEAGHAVVASSLPNLDPVHKITIVARGFSSGHTRLLPAEDRRLWTKSQLLDMLVFAMGGLAAEEITSGETTTGPGNDLLQATEMARKMVREYGMSEQLGAVVFTHGETGFLGEGIHSRDYSEHTANRIDREVERLLEGARHRARTILDRRRDQLTRVATRLIESETLQGPELAVLLGTRPADEKQAA